MSHIRIVLTDESKIMGQKVNPIGFRLGVRRSNWSARWYANKHDYSKFLEEDNLIRSFLEKKLRFALSVPRIVIERIWKNAGHNLDSSPWIVIGRKVKN